QRFWVTVQLLVAHPVLPRVSDPVHEPLPTPGRDFDLLLPDPAEQIVAIQKAPAAIPVAAVAPQPTLAAEEAPPVTLPEWKEPGGRRQWFHLVPVALLALTLGCVFLRDYFLGPADTAAPAAVEEGLLDNEPRIAVYFHNGEKND